MVAPGIVIAGAGEAGARAASTLREEGYDGPIMLIGDEPHPPYERPPLSKAAMTADSLYGPPSIFDADRLTEARIDYLAGRRVSRLDLQRRLALLDDGSAFPYAKLLIATGASPRRLALPGADDGGVRYLRTFADALALRERLRPGSRLTVIGGGFIGLEIAAGAVERGCEVRLIEMAPRLLMRGVPAEVAEIVKARHETAGVRILTGVAIDRIERQGDGWAVRLADGTAVDCDLIVAGIGAVPETALADASGLAVENGVRVDGTLRTSDAHVFAAGDCCAFPHPLYGDRRLRLEAWRNAQDQGALAARNMLGQEECYAAVPWFWSDQYDLSLQVAGLADAGTRIVRRESAGASFFFHLDDGGRLVALSSIGLGNAVARDVKLAEMMIARRLAPHPAALADPGAKLKTLLATSPPALATTA